MKHTLLLAPVLLFLLTSCGEQSTCSFADVTSAVTCACEINDAKKAAQGDDKVLETLRKKTNDLDDAFEKAIKDGNFTKKDFITKMKSDCESF